MTLFLLGASFARLKIPRPFLQKAPLWAIFWVCTAKMVILPVIGIFFVQGLVQRHVVRKEEIVLRFVTMLLSGGPSAVTWVCYLHRYGVVLTLYFSQLLATSLYIKHENDLDTLGVCSSLLLARWHSANLVLRDFYWRNVCSSSLNVLLSVHWAFYTDIVMFISTAWVPFLNPLSMVLTRF